MRPRILLVDDEVDFLDVVGDFLGDEGYNVEIATNGITALNQIERGHFDLLISDINMPGIKGFELIANARQLDPRLRTILITAYDVRDYLTVARRYDIGNILSKSTPFNFEEIRIMVNNILTGDVFGIQKYVDAEPAIRAIRTTADIEHVLKEIIRYAPEEYKRRFRQSLGEILVNAFFYGARTELGEAKEQWNFDATLADHEAIQVSWAADGDKMAAVVRDNKGRLTKDEILYWLERNTAFDENGVSIGLQDKHGKGLHIVRETIDRLIINIERGRRTEVVLLNYRAGLYSGYRPLWIQEL